MSDWNLSSTHEELFRMAMTAEKPLEAIRKVGAWVAMQFYAVGKAIKEGKMYDCEQIFKDILSGFEASDGVSNGLPPTKHGHFDIARLWMRLSECEQDAVYDFALDMERNRTDENF